MPKGIKGFQLGHKNFFKKHSQESKDKLSSLRIGKNNPMWRGGKKEFSCLNCNKIFYSHSIRKYCSNKCSNSHDVRLKKLSKIAKTNTEEKGHNWMGDKVGYNGIHVWVRKNKGKAKKCLFCKKINNWVDWANIDHKYKRNLDDYISLCRKCHKRYDLNFNNKKNE